MNEAVTGHEKIKPLADAIGTYIQDSKAALECLGMDMEKFLAAMPRQGDDVTLGQDQRTQTLQNDLRKAQEDNKTLLKLTRQLTAEKERQWVEVAHLREELEKEKLRNFELARELQASRRPDRPISPTQLGVLPKTAGQLKQFLVNAPDDARILVSKNLNPDVQWTQICFAYLTKNGKEVLLW